MIATFFQAIFVMIFAAIIGGLLSLMIVLPISYLVKRYTRVPKDRRQGAAVLASLIIVAVFILLQLVMHFRMRSELESLAREFAMDAHMESGDVCVSDEIVAERNRQLGKRGYIHIGRWWAAYGRDQPDVTTDTIIFYIPFL